MTHRKEVADSESSVRDELVQLRADIDNLVGAVGRLANGAAGSLVDEAKRTISRTGEEASEAYDAALAKSRRAMKTAGKTIKANPFLSIGIAAGVGLLLGGLLCHHSRG